MLYKKIFILLLIASSTNLLNTPKKSRETKLPKSRNSQRTVKPLIDPTKSTAPNSTAVKSEISTSSSVISIFSWKNIQTVLTSLHIKAQDFIYSFFKTNAITDLKRLQRTFDSKNSLYTTAQNIIDNIQKLKELSNQQSQTNIEKQTEIVVTLLEELALLQKEKENPKISKVITKIENDFGPTIHQVLTQIISAQDQNLVIKSPSSQETTLQLSDAPPVEASLQKSASEKFSTELSTNKDLQQKAHVSQALIKKPTVKPAAIPAWQESSNLLPAIHDVIFKISQPQFEPISKAFESVTGHLQAPESYTQSLQKKDSHTIQNISTISRNLKPYKYVIDSRGDGNCGYRAVLVSNYIEGLKKPAIFDNLHNLITDRFVDLFKEYDNTFTKQARPAVAQELQQYLLQKIAALRKCKTIEEIQDLVHNDTTFDYTMIMFERYLMVDHIKTKATPDEKMILQTQAVTHANLQIAWNDRRSIDEYMPLNQAIEPILTWKTELDQDTTQFLAKALNTTIRTVQRDSPTPDQMIRPDNSTGNAYILYIPGHYQILVPKDVAPAQRAIVETPSQLAAQEPITTQLSDNQKDGLSLAAQFTTNTNKTREFIEQHLKERQKKLAAQKQESTVPAAEDSALTTRARNLEILQRQAAKKFIIRPSEPIEYGYDHNGNYIGSEGLFNKEGKIKELD